jgi:RNA polymerase sigma factor (sigma-70 family)
MPKVDLARNTESIAGTEKDASIALREAVEALRPALHGYCARMTGSTIDGEDAVQDALLHAHAAILAGAHPPEMRFWLFRLAHNCSVDLLLTRKPEVSMDMEYLSELAVAPAESALERAMQKQSAQVAVSSFLKLPPAQRSTVILKDVLEYKLSEIGHLLHMPVTAVKAALHRGRARLTELEKATSPKDPPAAASPELTRFIELFNNRDWSSLTAMLSEDVFLAQTARAELRGRQQVSSNFFKGYDQAHDWRLQLGYLESAECAAVFLDDAHKPAYVMMLQWRGGAVITIRDFRYARYILNGAELTLGAPISIVPRARPLNNH